jgi:opacity protein-like surface antigen
MKNQLIQKPLIQNRAGMALSFFLLVTFSLFAEDVMARQPKRSYPSNYFFIGYDYRDGEKTEFKNESSIVTDNESDFSLGFGHNFNKDWSAEVYISLPNIDYEANLRTENNEFVRRAGEFDFFDLRLNVLRFFGTGRVRPYLTGGIGYLYIDSNIVSGVENVCWYDPWFGYYCGYETRTYGDDEMTLNAGAGVQVDIDRNLFTRLSYTAQWVDFDNSVDNDYYKYLRLDIGVNF